jgi:hypothetical protein
VSAPKPIGFLSQYAHSQLSGDLAVRLDPNVLGPECPAINAIEAQAIGMHDIGWEPLDQAMEHSPRTFLSVSPEDAARVAFDSGEINEAVHPVGGWMVSLHFSRLAESRLKENAVFAEFFEDERARRAELLPHTGRTEQELLRLTDVLRWCDLVSLIISAGAEGAFALPAVCGGPQIKMTRVDTAYHFAPFPFLAKDDLAFVIHAEGAEDRQQIGLRGAEF